MRTRQVLPFLGLVLFAVPLAAQGGLTPEQAAGMRQLGNVRISPDGKWVSYTVTTQDLKESTTNADIWLVQTSRFRSCLGVNDLRQSRRLEIA